MSNQLPYPVTPIGLLNIPQPYQTEDNNMNTGGASNLPYPINPGPVANPYQNPYLISQQQSHPNLPYPNEEPPVQFYPVQTPYPPSPVNPYPPYPGQAPYSGHLPEDSNPGQPPYPPGPEHPPPGQSGLYPQLPKQPDLGGYSNAQETQVTKDQIEDHEGKFGLSSKLYDRGMQFDTFIGW